MAVYEHDGLLTYIDENGNTHILHPVTKLENIEGADKLLSSETTEDGEEKNHVSGGGDTIVNVGTPEKNTDAANKEYVDTVVQTQVVEKVIYVETKADGSKEEHISGGNTTIINVANPVNNTDAVNKAYADAIKKTAEAAVKRAGDTMGGILNMGGFQVKNVAAPTESGDAVNKEYADAVGTRKETLFSNSNTSSAFPAQTKTISNLQDFDEFRVECAGDTGITEIGFLRMTETVLNNSSEVRCVVYSTIAYQGAVAQVFRGFIFSGTRIQILDCYAVTSTGLGIETYNQMLIPTKIIGIKYGSGAVLINGSDIPSSEGVLF